ncbi:MAG TPA: hypothetical protein VGK49_01835, partial [Ilumatobacteraceae bacterium]
MTQPVALGWRSHSGWAVLVAVRGSTAGPEVLDRQRVELVDGSLPRQPYHAVAEDGMSRDVIARVERMALETAIAATSAARDRFGAEAVGVVGRRRHIPDELDKVLSKHMLLHAAEGEMYELALLEAASQLGLPVSLLEPDQLKISAALDAA